MATLEVLMPIKDRLRELRTARGLTQQGLAARAGLSVSVIAHVEIGKITEPRLGTLRALAKALGVSMDELAGPDDSPPAPKRPRRRKGE